jgi:hypothetical protein
MAALYETKSEQCADDRSFQVLRPKLALPMSDLTR